MNDQATEARNALDVLAMLTETRPGNVRLNALDTLTRALKVSAADARALWAVRVLDAKVRQLGGCNVYWSSNDDTCGIHNWEGHDGWHIHGRGEDAARVAAAKALVAEDPSLGEGL